MLLYLNEGGGDFFVGGVESLLWTALYHLQSKAF
jgi:hypothetical protein